MRKGAIALLAMLAVPAACLPARAHAQAPVQAGEADCSTPRRALATWLANLQEGREHTDLAIRCFEWDRAGVPERDRSTVALRLKRVLDARGHFVVLDEIPDEEEPEDTTRVTPFPNNLPSFYLVRRDAAWLISAESIRATPSLYDETFALDVDALLASAPPWLRDRVLGLAWWQLLGLLLAIVTAFLLRQVVGWIVRSQGTKVLSRIAKSLDAELVRRAAMPIGTLGAVLLLDWMIPWLRLGGELSRVVVFGLRVGAAVSAVLIVYRMVDVLADVLGRRAEKTTSKLDDQLVPLVRKSLKVVTVILGLIFVLQNMEVDVASLIAGVSLGGLAFTLAARDTVANLFGSLSIFADQPFQVGDWVVMQGVE
ncbi:MAG: mechanosensitive ion channel family protein, partial [Sandaracinaceae bacterium]|nr:mechanosensitive ion channel family protein [Sandaracinaceae bacterium]